jgi:hypothetical protein
MIGLAITTAITSRKRDIGNPALKSRLGEYQPKDSIRTIENQIHPGNSNEAILNLDSKGV